MSDITTTIDFDVDTKNLDLINYKLQEIIKLMERIKELKAEIFPNAQG